MLRHVLNGLAKRTQRFQHFQRNMWMFLCLRSLARSGPSAHALVQRCYVDCYVNVAKRVQHPKSCTKNLTVFKFDPTSPNMHVATYYNISQQGGQTHATCFAQQCLPNNFAQDVALKCCLRLARP